METEKNSMNTMAKEQAVSGEDQSMETEKNSVNTTADEEAVAGEEQAMETEKNSMNTTAEGEAVAGEEQTMEMEKSKQIPEDSEKATLSKSAQKKLLKQQRCVARKAEKKAKAKELKSTVKDKKLLEWEEELSSVSEAEKLELIEYRRSLRKERMDKRSEEKEKKIQRLSHAKLHGQNVVIDFQFADLMTPAEINSLSQQVMYCYAVNSKCASPGHLWLTGCTGEIDARLSKVPGFDKWIVEKQTISYMEALQDRKDKLVYLTADAETVLDDLDLNDIYIIGGLVDRNRWKGITLKKAQEQGIRAAKLPIDSFLKMSSSQVLTVNQVVEILLKYLETRDWKTSFFQVIPQRKRDKDNSCEGQKKIKISSEENDGAGNENQVQIDDVDKKTETPEKDNNPTLTAPFFQVIPQQQRCEAGIDENGREGEDEKLEDKDEKKIKISSKENDGAANENQLQNDGDEVKADKPEKDNPATLAASHI